jgi:two-component system chemotaxis response regulator CheB
MAVPGSGEPVSHHDIITVGASAGGLDALQRLLKMLPNGLDASVFIVQHRHPEFPSRLPELLQRSTGLTVATPEDRQMVARGHVYVAPPDRHLLLDSRRLRVIYGPRENRHRPAIDPLFRSAAWSYGPRVIGVVLTGTMSDGAAGLWAVRSCGGVTMVQDPADAAYPGGAREEHRERTARCARPGQARDHDRAARTAGDRHG